MESEQGNQGKAINPQGRFSGFTSGFSPIEIKIFNGIKIIGISSLVVGALYWGGNKIINRVQKNNSLKDSHDLNAPDNYARRFHQAVSGAGTNEELIRTTMLSIPTKDFYRKVQRAYLNRYNRPLNEDLEGDLEASEQSEMDFIYQMLPEDEQELRQRLSNPGFVSEGMLTGWAGRLKAAADNPGINVWPFEYGTDEEAIFVALRELPTAISFCRLNTKYNVLYGQYLVEMLFDELGLSDLNAAFQIIMNKKDANGKQLEEICR